MALFFFIEEVKKTMCSTCPQCDSKSYKRNGYTRHGKQNHRCLDCGRQFSLEPDEFVTIDHNELLTNIIAEEQP